MIPFSEFVRNYKTKSKERRAALRWMQTDDALPKRSHIRTVRAYIYALPENHRVGAMGLFYVWQERMTWAEKTRRMRKRARLA